MKKTENKKEKIAVEPRNDGFFPILLSSICAFIALVAVIIDKFIFEFGSEILSPIVAQILMILLPAYIFMTMSFPSKKPISLMREIGIRRLRAEYVFFLIFTSFFAVTATLVLNMLFGGVFPTARGFSLLGVFSAGQHDFSVSPWYLIFSYALIPAFAEEFLFRGVIFSHLRGVNLPLAVVLSSALYALFTFSPTLIPAAFATGLILSFVLITTDSLSACMIVHFLLNLYGLFGQTNISQYFLTSQNNLLLIVIVLLALLLSSALFFAESARIYRVKATATAEEKNELPKLKGFRFLNIWYDLRALFTYKPTVISTAVFAAIYIAISIISAIS